MTTRVQREWQGAAVAILTTEAGRHERGPWIPTAHVLTSIRERTGCTSQAAHGALRALRTVGLAESADTHEGGFWKASDAAQRMWEVVVLPATEKINEKLDSIEGSLDEVEALRRLRTKGGKE